MKEWISMMVESDRQWARKVRLQEGNQEWSMRMAEKCRLFAQGSAMPYISIFSPKTSAKLQSIPIRFHVGDPDQTPAQVLLHQQTLVLVLLLYPPRSSRLNGTSLAKPLPPERQFCEGQTPTTILPQPISHHIIPQRQSDVADRRSLQLHSTLRHPHIVFMVIRTPLRLLQASENICAHPVVAPRCNSGQEGEARVIRTYITLSKVMSRVVLRTRR